VLYEDEELEKKEVKDSHDFLLSPPQESKKRTSNNHTVHVRDVGF